MSIVGCRSGYLHYLHNASGSVIFSAPTPEFLRWFVHISGLASLWAVAQKSRTSQVQCIA